MADPDPADKPAGPWATALAPLPQIFAWYKDNAVIGTVALAAFVVLKAYVLAKGDITTALSILEYAGLTTAVLAGLLSALPILAAATAAFTISRAIWACWPKLGPAPAAVRSGPAVSREAAGGEQNAAGGGQHAAAVEQTRWRPLVVMLAALAVACIVTQWTYVVVAIVVGTVTALCWYATRGLPARRRVAADIVIRGLTTALSVTAVIAMLYTVWVPHEVLTFRPGPGNYPPRQAVGYVLAEDNGWITLLTSGLDRHGIVRYPGAALTAQRICEHRPDSVWTTHITDAQTLWDVLASNVRAVSALRPAVNVTCPG